jgi:hypothetical protein
MNEKIEKHNKRMSKLFKKMKTDNQDMAKKLDEEGVEHFSDFGLENVQRKHTRLMTIMKKRLSSAAQIKEVKAV